MTTTRLAAQQPSATKVQRFPVFPPRGDMLNPIHLHLPGHQTALIFHFGDSPTTLVLSEVPIGWRHDQSRRGILIPDLLVVFDVDRDAIIDRRGYAIEEWGKPPDFVLEVASPSTRHRDATAKRKGYEDYKAREYWRFEPNPDAGWARRPGLAGDELVDGVYRPIEIVQVGDGMYWGRSKVLGLDVCWEHGELRFRDPESGLYLMTHRDERIGRLAAETTLDAERERRIAEYERRLTERERRIAAETAYGAERELRIAEYERRIAERERRIALEAENQRLRAELDRRTDL